MKIIRKIFGFSFIFGVLYCIIYYCIIYLRVYLDQMSGVILYSIIPIVYLLLIFVASYQIGKMHDLQKLVWATSISILSGLAIGTSLSFTITSIYYFITQPWLQPIFGTYFISNIVMAILESTVSMFFAVFAGLAMANFKSSERKELRS